jgi:two-component system response regulator HydG
MKKILIIDDDVDMCQLLCRFLKKNGYEAVFATNGVKGLKLFDEDKFDIVLCDFRLGDKDGVEVLKQIKEKTQLVPVIIITGYSDIKIAVNVMKHGAYDYITKPLLPDEVLNLIKKALESVTNENVETTAKLDGSNREATKKILPEGSLSQYMVGKSSSIKKMYEEIKTIAPTNYSVIIYGESGTGKEVVAKTIHQYSDRRNKPFVALDCGTLSRELASSELFGHVKGSFTGALTDKEGMFEAAEGGTLFLDEVANLPLDVQIGLLRVIQERKYKRVGSNKETLTDVRLIVASNEDLKQAYCDGKFREDLYHRFNEFSIKIPALRERNDDIPMFADFFLQIAKTELNKEIDGYEDEVIQLFKDYYWPGNLREFRNVVRRAALLTTQGLISKNVLPWEIVAGKDELATTPSEEQEFLHVMPKIPVVVQLKDAASQAEYETIMNVLKQVKYNKSKAAEILKIDRKTLYNKIKVYDQMVGNTK